MAKRVQRLGFVGSTLSSTTGFQRELLIDMTAWTVTVHDGTTVGGYPLAKADMSNAAVVVNNGVQGVMLGADKKKLDAYPVYANPFQLANGSAAAPAYSFSASPSTGIYQPSNAILGFAIAGNEAIRIDSTGVAIGVGAAAAASLHLYGSSTPTLLFQNAFTNTSGGAIATNGTNMFLNAASGSFTINNQLAAALKFAQLGVTKFQISSDGTGQFGGTTVPGTSQLRVLNSFAVSATTAIVQGVQITLDASGNAVINNSEAGTFTLETGGVSRITIGAGGNIGINSTIWPWTPSDTAIDFGTSFGFNSEGNSTQIIVNAYFNGTNWITKNNGNAWGLFISSSSSQTSFAISNGGTVGGTAGATAPFGTAGICLAIDPNTNVTQLRRLGSLQNGTVPAPTIAAGVGAGTSPTLSIAGGELAGTVSVTTGTSPTGSNAAVATITFNGAWINAPYIQLTPANAATAALSGTTQVFPTSTTTTFVINSGSTALAAATAYKWNYSAVC